MVGVSHALGLKPGMTTAIVFSSISTVYIETVMERM